MPTLYIAATDIGNRGDNTLRVREKIKSVNTVFVESFKEGSKFLKYIGVKKEMIEVSEHMKEQEVIQIIEKILREKEVVMISDCGTPMMEDPGRMLIEMCYEYNIKVVPFPGASCLTSAIMVSPFNMKEFYYAGLLPRNDGQRLKKLRDIKKYKTSIIILDTPYRIKNVLAACAQIFGERRALLLLDITTENEEICLNRLDVLSKKYENTKKREFVLIIEGQ